MSKHSRRGLARTVAAAFISAAVFLAAGSPTSAAPADPIVGTWAEIDEDGDVGAWVAISEAGGRFMGRIVKLFPGPGEPESPLCERCSGPRKGAPLMGLTIIESLRRQGDGYSGGRILDPEDGAEYQLEAHVGDGGRTLTIRAFVGAAILGRTQVWRRQP